MFWCLVDPTLTVTTIPSTISTTSYNVSATYTDTSASVVSNIIQQYQFNLYSATGSLLQSSGVVVGSGTQQGTSDVYDISYNFTGLNVGSSYYVTVNVTTTQGMSVTTQSNTFTVSIDTPTLGEATVVNNACDGYISVTSNLSGEYGGSGSGEIVSFETDSESVFSKLQVNLEPIQEGSGTPSPSNVRPIRGYGGVDVNVVGKNFLGVKKGTSGTSGGVTATINEDGSITLNGTATSNAVVIGNLATGYFGSGAGQNDGKKHIPKGQYIMTTGLTTNIGVRLQVYGTNQSSGVGDISAIIQTAVESMFTIDDTYAYNYARLFVEAGTYDNVTIKPMLRLASETDSTYEPYQGSTYTTDLPQTCYGGTLDLISGKLVVDRAMVVFDGTQSDLGVSVLSGFTQVSWAGYISIGITSAEFVSDTFEFDGTTVGVGKIYPSPIAPRMFFGMPTSITNQNEAQEWFRQHPTSVVYPLATPQTYQLTPQQVNTLVGTNNVWSEQGNIELSYHIPITNLLVKRQDVGDVSGGWLTLYSQPITQASDMDFTFIDFLNQYGKTYKYALVPLLTQTQSGVEVEVEGGYTVSNEVQSVFDGVFIADSTGSQKCKANVGYGNVDMNQVVGSITPIGAKYPIIVTNSHNQYHNGSISGTIVPDDYYFNGNLSRIDMVNKRNELEQFLTNKRVKVIKDWNGNIWLVMIAGNVSCTFNNNYGMGIVSFSTNWTEVGDPTNQQDLQATGLISVGGV